MANIVEWPKKTITLSFFAPVMLDKIVVTDPKKKIYSTKSSFETESYTSSILLPYLDLLTFRNKKKCAHNLFAILTLATSIQHINARILCN